MLNRMRGTVASLCIFAASIARAATPAETIKPFLTETTFAVIRVDLTKVDLKDAQKEVADSITKAESMSEDQRKAAVEQMQEGLKTGQKWLDDMHAAGANEVYVLFDAVQLQRGGPILVVPAGANADKRAISGLLHTGDPKGSTGVDTPPTTAPMRTMGQPQIAVEAKGAIVHASKTWIDQINKATPADRPSLGKAFDSAGDGMVQIAIVPTESIRNMLETLVATLPPEMGGAPITDLTRGIDYASIGMVSAADQKTTLLVQAVNPEAAAKIEEIINTGLDLLLQNPMFMNQMPSAKDLISSLRPKTQDAVLSVSIDKSSVGTPITALVLPRMIGARAQANQVKSASNMRQLLLASLMYANDNKGLLPEKLDALSKYTGGNEQTMKVLMTNPQAPERNPGYIYVRPAVEKIAKVKLPSNRLLIYESFDKWQRGVNVGFVDGHVEWVADQKRFETLLKEATDEPAKP